MKGFVKNPMKMRRGFLQDCFDVDRCFSYVILLSYLSNYMGIDNVNDGNGELDFSERDIGAGVYMSDINGNSEKAFVVTDVLSSDRIQVECVSANYEYLLQGQQKQRFFIKGLSDDELYDEYRVANGDSLKITVKVDNNGRKCLTADVIPCDFPIGIL